MKSSRFLIAALSAALLSAAATGCQPAADKTTTTADATTATAAAAGASTAHAQLTADHQKMGLTTAAWKRPTR